MLHNTLHCMFFNQSSALSSKVQNKLCVYNEYVVKTFIGCKNWPMSYLRAETPADRRRQN